MPSIEGLDPTLQTVGTLIFVAVVAIFSAWSLVFGRKKPQPETKEFSVAGQLADMGPVKELIEQTGLLMQQQVRTNLVLERLAAAAETAVAGYQADREEQDREEEVERRVAERLAEEGVTRRRAPRKTE
ncbi:MAG TPA: hypothetical protein VEC60_09835 [Reyranella sp.]|nr:hypothetical protein [Reyranella sp.]